MKKYAFLLSAILFLFYYSAYAQPQNIAPLATITANGGGAPGCQTGPCSTLNDLNLGTCGTQQMWINTGGTPSTTPGVDWIQWDFPTVRTFDTLVIHHGSATTRFLTGATVQYWDGANWITHTTFSGLPQQCVNRVPIGVLSAQRFRITAFIPGTGQQSNQNFREIEILEASQATDDAAMLSVDSPTVFCAGVQNVLVTIGNLGINQIDSVDVEWEVNGVAQPTVQYIGLLDTINGLNPFFAQVTLGTFNFPVGSSTIKAWTSNPNGQADTANFNDTVSLAVVTAAPPPQANVTNIGLTTATGNVGTATGLDYVVVPFGNLPGSGTPVTMVNSPFSITGLSASTTYDLYVRKNCGMSNVSAWVGPTTFNTAYAVPYAEDFETFPNGLFGNPWPRGWTSNTTTDPNWESQIGQTPSGATGPLGDHTTGSGVYCYMETSGGATGDSADFVSPPILIDSALTTVELGYWYFNFGNNVDEMKVLVDTNGVENLIATYVGQQQTAQTDPWLFDSHFLNGYNGKSVQIIFRGINPPCCSGDIAIDDISIDPVLPLDAGVTDVLSPSGAICPGTTTPIVEVRNFGSTQLDSVVVYWDINGVLDSTTYIGTVAPGATFPVTLGSVTFASGQIYNISFFTGDINGQPDQFAANNALTINGLQTGLSGTVTVDAGQPASATNFQTFGALAAVLNNYGVCGNATVNVANGTYNESFYLDNVPGLDMNNTLTIDGGDSSLTRLIHDGSVDAATITLDGSDYVTIQNMTVEHTSTTNGAAILLVGETQNNTVQNCIVRKNTSTTFFSTAAIAASGTNNSATTNYTNASSFNTFANNVIRGGNHGIRLNGDFNTINKVGNQIINNDIDSTWTYGVYIYGHDSLLIEGNEMSTLARGNNFGDGLYIIYASNTEIKGNLILSNDWSLYWTNTSASVVAQGNGFNELSNNMIVSNNDYGAYLYAIDSLNMWYNSVQSFGTSPAVYLNTFGSYTVTEVDMRNNILSADASVALDMNGMTDTIFSKCDNNNYYTANGTNLVDINGTTYTDLPAWQTGSPTINLSSLEGNPQFLSNTDLHVIGSFVNDSGDASVPILVDIDGEVRPSPNGTNVDIGADEFDPPTCPPVTSINAFNPSLDSVTLTWGGAPLVDYQYSIVPTGSPISNPVLTPFDSIRVGGLMSSTTYDVYVRIICGRGDTSLWLGPVSFNTANGIPFFEDFETFTATTTNNGPFERGWTSTATAFAPSWQAEDANNGFNENSGATGPVWDHTFFGGPTNGMYMYMEGSGGTTGDSVDFISPPIFVDSSQNVFELSYWYFFHGANIDQMKVFIDNNGVLSQVSNIVGQQQTNQNTDPWLKDSILVSGYAGQSIQLIFRAYNGTGFTDDMAIDDISLDVVSPLDIAPLVLAEPIDDSLQCYTAAENVTVTIFNGGTQAIDFTTDSVDVDVDVSGSVLQTLSTTINDNSLNGGLPLASGDSLDVTLGTIPMTATGLYSFVISTNLAGDGNTTNDTIVRNINVLPVSGGAISGSDTICFGDTVVLSVSGTYGAYQWQEFDGTNWNNITGATGSDVTVSPASTTDYRVQACGTQNSAVFTLTVINLSAPTAINDTQVVVCGDSAFAFGSVTSTNPNVTFAWFEDPVGGIALDSNAKVLVSAGTDSLRYKGVTGLTPAASDVDTFWVEAQTGGGANGPTLVITEAQTGSDMLEIQNVSGGPLDVTGWSVAISDDYTNINAVNGSVQTLSGVWAPDSVRWWGDVIGANDWGNNMLWNPGATFGGWALIIDDLGNVVDFVVWEYPAATVASMSVTVNSFTVTPTVNDWVGGAIPNTLTGNESFYRQGNSDNDDLSDFIINPEDRGVINNGLLSPFAGGGCVSPRVPVVVGVICNPVGVDELTSLEEFSVYPNPSNGLFTISMNTNADEDYNLTIRDVQGKQVYSEMISVNGEYRRDLDLSDLAKGVYYLQIQDGENSKVEKLIIQ